MLNIYLTTVPLQGKFDLEKIAYGSTLPGGESIQTRFPILQVIHDTMQPNDSAQVLVIRQKNADTARNYTYLLEELTAQGIPEDKVVQIALPEKQDPATLVGLCRDVTDALPQVGRVYACITYGTKSIPVVEMAALRCAEATHTELEVGGLYYGEVQRLGGVTQAAHLHDVSVLYRLAGLVDSIHDPETAEEVFRQLIWVYTKEA